MDFLVADVVTVLAGAAGLILNASQLVHLLCRSQLTVFNKTLVSLCISDLLSCFSFIGNGVANIIVSIRAIRYTATALNVFIAGSTFHLLFIGLQRLIAIALPLKVNQIFNTKRCALSLCLIWIAATTYGILVYHVFWKYTNMTNALTIFVSGTTLVALYIGIGCKIGQRDRLIRRASQRNQNHQRRMVFLHSACVTIAFALSYLPFAITELFISSRSLSPYLFYSLMTFKPIMNALVYFCLQFHRHRKMKNLAKKSTKEQNKSHATET